MNEQYYVKIAGYFQKNPTRKQQFLMFSRLLTLSVYGAYAIVVIISFFMGMHFFAVTIMVPALSFILLSAFRYFYNAPRPYEELQIEPLIEKDTKGKSFPSRHVFSAFLIASVVWSISKAWGVFYYGIAAMIGISRVIGGVHYVKDVMAGSIAGILLWSVGFKLFNLFF